jgi:hypothetical protein
LVGQAQAELLVDLGFVGGVGLVQDGGQAAEAADERGDLFAGQPGFVAFGDLAEFGFGFESFGLGLGDPAGDQRGVGAGLESGPVAGELGLAVGDLLRGPVGGRALTGIGLGVCHRVDGLGELGRVERLGEPGVERVDDGFLQQVDVAGVIDLVSQRVLRRKAAPVVGGLV